MSARSVVCGHCQSKGVLREIGPSTRNTPMVFRSDEVSFHLYLEELHPFRVAGHVPKMAALFRYSADSPAADAESTLVMIPDTEDTRQVEQNIQAAADQLEKVLRAKRRLKSRYTLGDQNDLM